MISSVTTDRIRRLIDLTHETYQEKGAASAGKVFVKSFVRKLPLLARQVISAHRVKAARMKIDSQKKLMQEGQPFLGVALTGGLGDSIVVARFLRDMLVSLDDAVFDIFSPTPQRTEWVFENIPGFHSSCHDVLFEALLPSYDFSMRANQAVVIYREKLNFKKLYAMPDLVKIAEKVQKSRRGIEAMIQNHPFLDNFLGQMAVFRGHRRHDFLHSMAGLRYGGDQLPISTDSRARTHQGLEGKRYVTVHNGFDSDFIVSGRRSTKCYPHFGKVVSLLKQEFPDLTFVQLGVAQTSQPLPECDLNLVGKTSLPEVADLLAHACFHLDNESGLVHLARCFETRSAVVFGPTSSAYFGYPDNLAIEPLSCGNCWWLTRTWMDRCAKGHPEPICMTQNPPERVAQLVADWVRRKKLMSRSISTTEVPECDSTSEVETIARQAI